MTEFRDSDSTHQRDQERFDPNTIRLMDGRIVPLESMSTPSPDADDPVYITLRDGAKIHVSSLPEEARQTLGKLYDDIDPAKMIPRADEAALLTPEILAEINEYLEYKLDLNSWHEVQLQKVRATEANWKSISRIRGVKRELLEGARDAYDQALRDSSIIGQQSVRSPGETKWIRNGPPFKPTVADTRQILPATAKERGEVAFLLPDHERAKERKIRDRMRQAWQYGGYQSALQTPQQEYGYYGELKKMRNAGGSQEQLVAAWSREVPQPRSAKDFLGSSLKKITRVFPNRGSKS